MGRKEALGDLDAGFVVLCDMFAVAGFESRDEICGYQSS
jgi:hypothetical protein